MTGFLEWSPLVVLGIAVISVGVSCWLLRYVTLHHFRFGLERHHVPLSTMNIEQAVKAYTAGLPVSPTYEIDDKNVITLDRDDYWEVKPHD